MKHLKYMLRFWVISLSLSLLIPSCQYNYKEDLEVLDEYLPVDSTYTWDLRDYYVIKPNVMVDLMAQKKDTIYYIQYSKNTYSRCYLMEASLKVFTQNDQKYEMYILNGDTLFSVSYLAENSFDNRSRLDTSGLNFYNGLELYLSYFNSNTEIKFPLKKICSK